MIQANADNRAPIGVFDSGVGGLTVCRKIAETLPNESLIYLGDTARVPYGSKSRDTVTRYALSCARLLLEHGIKMLVVACNTASAFALPGLKESLDIPVVGVLEPGAIAAVKHTVTGCVGVIGTRGVIASGSYEDLIVRMRPNTQVFSQACPLFVPFAEEGWTDGDAIASVARSYLGGMAQKKIDTLVLGCTHYPLLYKVISSVMGAEVTLVDSAEETAKAVANKLAEEGLANPVRGKGERSFMVTDSPETFRETGMLFWGKELERVEWVDICTV